MGLLHFNTCLATLSINHSSSIHHLEKYFVWGGETWRECSNLSFGARCLHNLNFWALCIAFWSFCAALKVELVVEWRRLIISENRFSHATQRNWQARSTRNEVCYFVYLYSFLHFTVMICDMNFAMKIFFNHTKRKYNETAANCITLLNIAFTTFFHFLFITFHSACKSNFVKSLKTKIPEIPPFRGHVANNMYNKIVETIKKTTTG